MSEITICLKQYLSEENCRKIEELKKKCTDIEEVFLKLELEFKLNMSHKHKDEPYEYANEFFYYSGEALVGYLGICSFGGVAAELTGMVHPLYRKKGIFQRLYSLAKDECIRRNFKKILLVCDNRSSSGLSFIKSTGAVYAFSEYEMKFDNNYISEQQSEIVLRKASNIDAEEIARQNELYFGDTDKIVVMPEDEEKRGRIMYMVEAESSIIGKIKIDFDADQGFISAFGILPEFRKRGYGKQALKAALHILNENNIHKVGLEVAAENKNALNLYKSCGFEEQSVTDYYEDRTVQ